MSEGKGREEESGGEEGEGKGDRARDMREGEGREEESGGEGEEKRG